MRRPLTALLVVLAAAVHTSGAGAAETVGFAATGPIGVAAGKAVTILVCNGGGSQASPTLTVEGLRRTALEIAGKTRGTVAVVVPSGRCTPVRIAAASGADAGKGTLVLITGAGIARRALAISAPPAARVAPKSPFTEIELAARHHFLAGKATYLLAPANVAFGPYATAKAINAGAVDAPAKTIAVLQHGAERAYLVVDGSATSADDHGIAALPVKIDGADKTGAYKGTISYTKADGSTGTVALTVNVGDSIGWCIAAILLGILLAVLLPFVTQRIVPGVGLWYTRRHLQENYRDAVAAYETNREKQTVALPILTADSAGISSFSNKLRSAYKRVLRHRVLVDFDSSDYKAVQDLLDNAADDRAYLEDPHGLAADLVALRKSIEAFAPPPPGEGTPALITGAHGSLENRAIAVGDATKLGVDSGAFVGALAVWRRLYERLVAYEDWANSLPQRVALILFSPDQTIDDARGLLARARVSLFDSETPTELTAAGVDQLLADAEAILITLTATADQSAQEGERSWESVRLDGLNAAHSHRVYLAAATEGLGTLSFHADRLARPVHAIVRQAKRLAHAPAVESAAATVSYAAVGVAGYALIVALAVGGALATTLPTVYSATFGSLGDYLTALGIGGAAGVASKALIDGVTSMRRALS